MSNQTLIYAASMCDNIVTGENMIPISAKEEDEIFSILRDLSKSYEYYCACNKPKEEWDEYDTMMYPVWLRLKKLLEEIK